MKISKSTIVENGVKYILNRAKNTQLTTIVRSLGIAIQTQEEIIQELIKQVAENNKYDLRIESEKTHFSTEDGKKTKTEFRTDTVTLIEKPAPPLYIK